MKLLMEILTGSFFYVEVGEDATVGGLKKEIGRVEKNLPTDRLILLADIEQRILMDRDEALLEDYGVQDNSRVYIFFEPYDDEPHGAPIEIPSFSEPNVGELLGSPVEIPCFFQPKDDEPHSSPIEITSFHGPSDGKPHIVPIEIPSSPEHPIEIPSSPEEPAPGESSPEE